jgi:hypothetical protein
MTYTPSNPAPQNEDGEMELLRKLVSVGVGNFGPAYQSGTNLYAFGDSHTEGQLAVAVASWAPGAVVTAAYRYANILAALTGQTLTNYGVSGSSIGYSTANLWNRKTMLHQAGQNLAVTWTGTVTCLAGYNDANAGYQTDENNWLRLFTWAQEAFIARALLAGYITVDGTTHTGAAGTVTTTGSVTGEAYPEANPFPIGTPGTDPRRVMALTGTQNFATTLTSKSVAAVFFSTTATAGAFTVAVNGAKVADVTVTHPSGGSVELPACVVIRDLPATAAITVTNVSGTSRIWAIGWIDAPSTATNLARSVVMGTVARFQSANRSDSIGRLIGQATRNAVARWGDFRVFLADIGANTTAADTVTGSGEGADPDHPNLGGNRLYARIFRSAGRATAAASQSALVPSPLNSSTEVRAAGTDSLPSFACLRMSYNGTGYLDYWNGSGYAAGEIRASALAVNCSIAVTGAVTATTNISGTKEVRALGSDTLPAFAIARLSYNGGAYLDSWNGAALAALSVRGAAVRIEGTSVTTSATLKSESELHAANSTGLNPAYGCVKAHYNGTGYVDFWNGSALTAGEIRGSTVTLDADVIFKPQATPGSPTEGMSYFDSTTKKLRVYDGTAWQNCW